MTAPAAAPARPAAIRRRVAVLLLGASLVVPGLLGGAAPARGATPGVVVPALAQLVGQKLMVAMSGTTPSAALLGRVKRGEVGGVILFGANIGTAASLTAATDALQAAAAAGGQPRLLIATDQEGGAVKRVPWAPPTLSPPQMGADGRASTARAQGVATARVLGCGGIDTNLAPVADVPASTSSFIYAQGRAWSFSASVTATLSAAFAQGTGAALGVPAMKHFPGLGFAVRNTDASVVTIAASAAALAPGLAPYKAAIANGIPMVMLSNATYTAYDAANAAGWSRAVSVDLLRGALGFKGVTITDSLTGTAKARGVSDTSLAILAASAGTDMILLTGSEAATAATYSALLAAASAGSIPLADLQASYARIVALKAALKTPAHDTVAPVASAPVSRLYAPATLGTTTVPVRTAWTASDPCGISAYGLRRQAYGSAFVDQVLASPRAALVKQDLAPGVRYRYAVRATDGAANTGAFDYGAWFVASAIQETDATVAHSGAWAAATSSAASGGATAFTTQAGAAATLSISGTSAAWVSPTGPTRGSARVYVDGVLASTVSLYAATGHSRQVVFATSWATTGKHTIRIVNLGTSGHPRIDLDAFLGLAAP